MYPSNLFSEISCVTAPSIRPREKKIFFFEEEEELRE